jgi:hypothetical protein
MATPSIDDLQIVGIIECAICGAVVKNRGALRIHVAKAHRDHKDAPNLLLTLSSAFCSSDSKFYCPEPTCPRSDQGTQPFTRLGQLRQHWGTVHGEKKYVCTCTKAFGMQDAFLRHKARFPELSFIL